MPVTLNVRERGRGPVVLLLGGSPTPARHLNPLAEALATNHRVLIVDLPGYEGSPALPGKYTIAGAQALIEDALLAREVESLAVVGLSLGAYRAFALAFSERVRVTHVVSLGGFAGFDSDVGRAIGPLIAALRAGADVSESFRARMLSADYARSHPVEVAEVMSWLGLVSGTLLADELQAAIDAPDLRERLSALDIPILARVGALDGAVPPLSSEQIVRSARRGKLEIVDGRGHLLLLEDGPATIASIARALS